MYTYPERPPHESGFCSMSLVWALADLGVPRRAALLMSEQQATAMLACVVRDRLVDSLLAGKEAHHGN